MAESFVKANGVNLAFDEFGDKAHPAIVLVMGLGTQMIAWPISLCEDLASRGFRVIRFDNRDVGLSQKFDGLKPPNPLKLALFPKLKIPLIPPYTLHDMAKDAIGLCDALGIQAAHWVGASMGGMIAQIIAGEHPKRSLSLTSIMSTSGAPGLPGPNPAVLMRLIKKPSSSPAERLEYSLGTYKLIGSPGYPASEETLRQRIKLGQQRSFYPEGYPRHVAAIAGSGDRCTTLAKISVPTLIIHGKADVLVPPACGIDTHKRIPLSKLTLIEGMGHDLPEALCPQFAELIAENASKAR